MKNSSFLLILAFFNQHRERIVYLTALFFLVAGLGYSLYLGNTIRFPDEKEYYQISQNVAAGKGYSHNGIDPTALRTPVYPLFLALFTKLGAPIIVLRYLNFIALAACVFLISSILKHEKAQSGAGVAAALLAGYGVIFYTAGTLYTQTLFTLILLCVVRLAINRNFRYPQAVLLGLLSAVLIMLHPTGIFIPPLVVLWLYFPRNYDIIIKGAIAALVAVACISIWSYRNYKTFNRFMPLSSHGADTLYIGNNPNTSISSWYSYFDDGHHLKIIEMPEKDMNSYYLQKTMEFWTEHTGDAIRLYLAKVLYHFNYKNKYAYRPENKQLYNIIMFVTYYPLLICLALRLFMIRRHPLSRVELLFVAIYIASALFHAIFIPRIRFRLPYDVILICHIGMMFSILRQRLIANHSHPKLYSQQ